jgi:hypothetical protein
MMTYDGAQCPFGFLLHSGFQLFDTNLSTASSVVRAVREVGKTFEHSILEDVHDLSRYYRPEEERLHEWVGTGIFDDETTPWQKVSFKSPVSQARFYLANETTGYCESRFVITPPEGFSGDALQAAMEVFCNLQHWKDGYGGLIEDSRYHNGVKTYRWYPTGKVVPGSFRFGIVVDQCVWRVMQMKDALVLPISLRGGVDARAWIMVQAAGDNHIFCRAGFTYVTPGEMTVLLMTMWEFMNNHLAREAGVKKVMTFHGVPNFLADDKEDGLPGVIRTAGWRAVSVTKWQDKYRVF